MRVIIRPAAVLVLLFARSTSRFFDLDEHQFVPPDPEAIDDNKNLRAYNLKFVGIVYKQPDEQAAVKVAISWTRLRPNDWRTA